ncbi:MAG: TlpA disulfide reductase family protein [Myxococcota bacterium]|nr:TlpA disulfide reductase family protein [Myxococcota bacterium]
MKTMLRTLALGCALLLVACSPRNGLHSSDDDDSAPSGTCSTAVNTWPEVLPEYLDYEGDGSQEGDRLYNFQLQDQFGQTICLSHLLGSVLILDASTLWCGPCNEAAAESAELWAAMKEIGPSWITTLLVQDGGGLPATSSDVDYWVSEYDIEYPVVLDEDEATASDWQVSGSYPLFLFVAPTGEIIERRTQKPSESEVLSFVEFAVEEWSSELRPSSD